MKNTASRLCTPATFAVSTCSVDRMKPKGLSRLMREQPISHQAQLARASTSLWGCPHRLTLNHFRLRKSGGATRRMTSTRNTSSLSRLRRCRSVTCSSGPSLPAWVAGPCCCSTSCSSIERPAATGYSRRSRCRSGGSLYWSRDCRAIKGTTTGRAFDVSGTSPLSTSQQTTDQLSATPERSRSTQTGR